MKINDGDEDTVILLHQFPCIVLGTVNHIKFVDINLESCNINCLLISSTL